MCWTAALKGPGEPVSVCTASGKCDLPVPKGCSVLNGNKICFLSRGFCTEDSAVALLLEKFMEKKLS